MRKTVILIVVGTCGKVSKELKRGLGEVEIGERIETNQTKSFFLDRAE